MEELLALRTYDFVLYSSQYSRLEASSACSQERLPSVKDGHRKYKSLLGESSLQTFRLDSTMLGDKRCGNDFKLCCYRERFWAARCPRKSVVPTSGLGFQLSGLGLQKKHLKAQTTKHLSGQCVEAQV